MYFVESVRTLIKIGMGTGRVEEPRVAQQRSVTLVDDLDGGKAAETVVFGLDGALYTIDVSKRNAAALRKVLAEFVDHARRVKATKSAGPGRAGKRPVPRSGPQPVVVREWAAAQGISVSARGRIPAEVVARYQAAQP
jgi:hypothetical protein